MKPVRVLVVDDSSTMRHILSGLLARDRDIEVVGQAADAFEARQAIKQLNPDVMTLDVEMPNMNGIEFLEKVMRLRPMPVIMVSTLTAKGTDATLAALEIGAFDCIAKPSGLNQDSFHELPAKVKAAAMAKGKLHYVEPVVAPKTATVSSYRPKDCVVAIGSSTGGVEALQAVISQLPGNCPPVVITQHMPPNFTKSFAARLDRSVAPHVCEAHNGLPLQNGNVYLAPGGSSHMEISGSNPLRCSIRPGPLVNGHCPSVDVLFNSVAKVAPGTSVGVILTGMGRDGASGLREIRRAGGRTIGQDESSSIVYGMPRVAFEEGAVERQIALNKIGAEILRLTNIEKSGVH